MTVELNAKELKKSVENITHKLKAYPNNTPVSKNIEDKKAWSFGLQNKASISLSNGVSFHVLNSKDDLKDEPVIGVNDNKDDVTRLSKPLNFDVQTPYCRYQLSAEGKGEGGASYREAGFAFDINSGLSLTSYMPHSPGESVIQAVKNDLMSLPVILESEDVVNLTDGQAVSMSVSGELKTGAKLAWSDLLSSCVGAVSELVGNEALALSVSGKATVDINFSLSGGFQLVYARPAGKAHLHLGLFKGSKETFGVGVGLALEASFANPNAAKTFIKEQADQLFRVSESIDNDISGVIKRIKEASSFDELPDKLLPVIEKLRENLGLDHAVSELQELQERINQVEQEIEQAIEEAATQKASVAFSYQYNRVAQTTALIEAEIDPLAKSFERLHAHAIKGQFGKVVTIIANDDKCQLTSFFRQTEIHEDKEYGFKLSILNKSFFGLNYKENNEVITSNVHGQKMITFDAQRGYKTEYFSSEENFYFDFDAHMKGFSVNENPTADEFDFSLTVALSNNGVGVTPEQIVDTANTWGIVDKDNIKQSVTLLDSAVAGGSIKQVFASISVDDVYFEYLLGVLINVDNKTLGKAYARALSYVDSARFPYRSSAEDREFIYASIFEQILDKKEKRPWQLSWQAGMKKVEFGSELAKFEYPRNRPAQSEPNTLAYTLYKHGSWQKKLNKFLHGLQHLQLSIEHKKSYKRIKPAYKIMEDMGSTHFYVRFLGALLAVIKTDNWAAQQSVKSFVNITYELEGESYSFLLGKK